MNIENFIRKFKNLIEELRNVEKSDKEKIIDNSFNFNSEINMPFFIEKNCCLIKIKFKMNGKLIESWTFSTKKTTNFLTNYQILALSNILRTSAIISSQLPLNEFISKTENISDKKININELIEKEISFSNKHYEIERLNNKQNEYENLVFNSTDFILIVKYLKKIDNINEEIKTFNEIENDCGAFIDLSETSDSIRKLSNEIRKLSEEKNTSFKNSDNFFVCSLRLIDHLRETKIKGNSIKYEINEIDKFVKEI